MTTVPRVLLVDDDPDYRDMLSRALRQSGFKPLLAEAAPDGAAKAKSLRPDLIILDIHMPGMDGIRLHRALRRTPQTSHIPIILLTGKTVLKSLLEETAASLGAEPVHSSHRPRRSLSRPFLRTSSVSNPKGVVCPSNESSIISLASSRSIR